MQETDSTKPNFAEFLYFTYQGKDPRFNVQIDHSRQYFNPIISGYYPDPSILRVDDTYYLVNSSFGYFPGVPLFTSKDLINWKQIGHVLDRESQLPLKGTDISSGIFAPQISYNIHNKTFYMTTMNMGRFDVFYVKTKDPSQGWSEPIHMKRGGMDTSFFFDNDGKAYVVYNARPFDKQRYEGDMAIHMNEFDWKADTIKSKTYELVRGGSHCTENPIWIEGPHMYHIGKFYYLMAAEGGTGDNHSEVIFRSKSPYGPWDECPTNPILTQRYLKGVDRPDMVNSTGHASLLQDKEGKWWAAFLACRPYEEDLYNTGRETFLLPVIWKNGWPTILEHGKAVPTLVNKTNLQHIDNLYLTGNFHFTDYFEKDKLDLRWIYLRNPDMSNFQTSTNGIRIKAIPTNIKDKNSPAAIFYRQKHTTFSAETEINFTPTSSRELAGMVLIQNEDYNFVFGKTIINNQPAITLKRSEKADIIVGTVFLTPEESIQPLDLKIEGDGKFYSFYYKSSGASWKSLAIGVDASNLSTAKAGGFTGTQIGLYATSTNQ